MWEMKREGEGRCHQVPALLKHHGEQKMHPPVSSGKSTRSIGTGHVQLQLSRWRQWTSWRPSSRGWDHTLSCYIKKKYLKGTISGRMLLALEGLEGFEGFMFSNLRGVGIEWYWRYWSYIELMGPLASCHVHWSQPDPGRSNLRQGGGVSFPALPLHSLARFPLQCECLATASKVH